MSATVVTPDQLRRANLATFVVFALNGMAFASWAGRIPTTRDLLGVTPGQLGFVLLAGSMGAIVGLPLAGTIVSRFGAAKAVLLASAVFCTALACVGFVIQFTHSPVATAAVLFVLNLGIGICDVSMNLEGAAVERHLKRSTMPHYHAAFSLGTVLSALVAAGFARLGVPIAAHLAGAAILVFIGIAAAVRAYLPHAVEADEASTPDATANTTEKTTRPNFGPRQAWAEPRTLLIGLVTLVAAFTEGAANDWMSLAFVDGYHLPEWAGILGFTVFLAAMTAGRLLGTGLLDRYGRVPTLRVMFVLAGVGSIMVVFGTTATAFVGAVLWGLGVSLGFPCGMSAAADDPARAAARVSAVSTIAYGAFLIGPTALGMLGDHVGVLRSLTVVSVLLLAALVAVPALREPEANPVPEPDVDDVRRA